MHYKSLLFLFVLLSNTAFAFQSNQQSFIPKKEYDGFRVLIANIQIIESNKEELLITCQAVNTGRKPVELGTFSKIPPSLLLKFEESFYRSSLRSKEEEIKNQLFGKSLSLPIGKIIRNISLTINSDEDLYKSLGKKKQKYTRHYQPKVDKSKPNLNYKTANKKDSNLAIFNKKKESEAKIVEVKPKKEEASKKKPRVQKKESKKETKVAEAKPKVENQTKPIKKESTNTKVNETAIAKQKAAQPIKKEKIVETTPKPIKKEKVKDSSLQKNESAKKETSIARTNKKTQKEAEIKTTKPIVSEPAKKNNSMASSKAKKEKTKFNKKEIRENEEQFNRVEKKKLKEKDDKEVLAILGVEEKEEKKKEKVTSEPIKKRSGSLFGEKNKEESYSIKEGVDASKKSYAEKEVCPDIVVDTIIVIKKTPKYLHIEYTVSNTGKGPAYLLGQTSSDEDNLAVRAFLSSSDNLTRGSLPIGGGFVKGGPKDGVLEPNASMTASLRLDIKKMTRFTPYLILSLDPFNTLTECDKTNNKSPKLIN